MCLSRFMNMVMSRKSQLILQINLMEFCVKRVISFYISQIYGTMSQNVENLSSAKFIHRIHSFINSDIFIYVSCKINSIP